MFAFEECVEDARADGASRARPGVARVDVDGDGKKCEKASGCGRA